MKACDPVVRDYEKQKALRAPLLAALSRMVETLEGWPDEWGEALSLHDVLHDCDYGNYGVTVDLATLWYDTRRIALAAYDFARRMQHKGAAADEDCVKVFSAADAIMDAPTFRCCW